MKDGQKHQMPITYKNEVVGYIEVDHNFNMSDIIPMTGKQAFFDSIVGSKITFSARYTGSIEFGNHVQINNCLSAEIIDIAPEDATR